MPASVFSSLATAINRKDGLAVGTFLRLYNPSVVAEMKSAGASYLNSQAEKFKFGDWRSVLKAYTGAVIAGFEHEDMPEAFKNYNGMVIALNHLIINLDNWIVPALECIHGDLRRMASLDKTAAKVQLEVVARTLNGTLRACLNDRNEDESRTKRLSVCYFASGLLAIYFQLGAFSLASGTIKVVQSLQHVLPPFEMFGSKERASYLYYSGVLKVIDGHYAEANSLLMNCLELTPRLATSSVTAILQYLLPVRLFTSYTFPKKKVWLDHQSLAKYEPLFDACRSGSWGVMNQLILEQSRHLVHRHLFLLYNSLCNQCLLRATLRLYKLDGRHNRMSFERLAALFRTTGYFEAYHLEKEAEFHSMELILAGFIRQNLFKGYIAHDAQTVVLSGKQPFPTLLPIKP